MAWYSLNDPDAPGDPSSYQEIGSPSGCSGNNQICAVQASEGSPGFPDLTDALKNEMLTALNTHSTANTPNVRLKT